MTGTAHEPNESPDPFEVEFSHATSPDAAQPTPERVGDSLADPFRRV